MKFLNTLFLAFIFTSLLQAQIFVKSDAQGGNNGTSWADAYTSLDDALANSEANGEIWVAAGVYKPGGMNPATDTSFVFPHNLKLYGGFDGTESDLGERDWGANETILSGDHNGDDKEDDFSTNRSDNARHVMFLSGIITDLSIVDGFTIRNGQTLPASGSGNDRRGGGILTLGNPIVQNCTFTQNYAYFGGGLYPRTSGLVEVYNCRFEKNHSNDGNSAAFITTSSDAIIEDCVFIDNFSNDDGNVRFVPPAGVVSNYEILNCTFEKNESYAPGSGISMPIGEGRDVDLKIEDCIFHENNSILNRGALRLFATGGALRATIEDCTFTDNAALLGGGAVFLFDNSDEGESIIDFVRCTFENNTSNYAGGALLLAHGTSDTMAFNNCIFSDNTASDQGGAVNIEGGSTEFTNSLFFSNGVDTINGGAIFFQNNNPEVTSLSLLNNTFAKNLSEEGNDLFYIGSDTTNITMQNSVLASTFSSSFASDNGNVDLTSNDGNVVSDNSLASHLTQLNDLHLTDPLFVDATLDDFHLMAGSPCIDNGTGENAPPKDIEGTLRQDEVDSGAFEFTNSVNIVNIDPQSINFTISPNPTSEVLSFHFENDKMGQFKIAVIGVNGQVYLEREITKDTGFFQDNIDVKKLKSGSYVLLLELDDRTRAVTRFLKL